MTKHVSTEEAEKASTRVARRAILRDPAFDAMVGNRIRALRTARGVSQSALAADIGVSFQQVQKYEKGRDRISASMLRSVAMALEVHPGEFYDDAPSVEVAVEGAAASPKPMRELRALMRAGDAFARISDPKVRKRAIALIETLADGDAGDV